MYSLYISARAIASSNISAKRRNSYFLELLNEYDLFILTKTIYIECNSPIIYHSFKLTR